MYETRTKKRAGAKTSSDVNELGEARILHLMDQIHSWEEACNLFALVQLLGNTSGKADGPHKLKHDTINHNLLPRVDHISFVIRKNATSVCSSKLKGTRRHFLS